MNRNIFLAGLVGLGFTLFLGGCGGKVDADASSAAKDTAPPAATVEHEENSGLVKVDHPDQFPLVVAGQRMDAPELNVTGSVTPDVSRNIPVISLASGRVVEIHARIGDTVKKGDLLMRVQSSDISGAFSDYRQAMADEKLAKKQLERSQILYEKGALAQKDLEVARIRSPIAGPLADAKYDWYTNYGDFAGTNANVQGLQPPLRMRWARRLEGTIKHLPVVAPAGKRWCAS